MRLLWFEHSSFQLQTVRTLFPTPRDTGHPPYIQTALESGLVIGISETTFHPDSPVRREEAATMIWRYLKQKGINPAPREITWIPTIENMLEDAILMTALYVWMDKELSDLAKQYSKTNEKTG